MSLWSFVLYALLPVGVTLLALLTVPLPAVLSNTSQCRAIRGVTLKLFHGVLFTNLNGALPVSLIHLLLALLLFATAFLGSEVWAEYRHHHHAEHHAHADVLMMQQAKLWRNQRNCYLALSALITYWALYCVLTAYEKIHRLEQTLSTHSPNAPYGSRSNNTTEQRSATRSRPTAPGTGTGTGNGIGTDSASKNEVGSGIEGLPAIGGKLDETSDSLRDNDTEKLADNPLLRQRLAANSSDAHSATPQPSAPPASLINSGSAKKDK